MKRMGRSAADLTRSLDYLKANPLVGAEEVAVLFCPAVSKSRYRREAPSFHIGRWLRRQHYDFVQRQSFLSDWPAYHQMVVQPLASSFRRWQSLPCTVLLDATWYDLKKVLARESIQFVVIIAHHAVLPTGEHAVELADGCRSFQKINELLDQLDRHPPVSLAWFTCEATDWVRKNPGEQAALGALGTASWKMPLLQSVEFATEWIAALDKQHSLKDAWQQALEKTIT